MRVPSVDFIHEQLMGLPENVDVPYGEIRERAGEFLSLLTTVAFGEPESLRRSGKNFTAKAKAPATIRKGLLTIHSDRTVYFTENKVGKELQLTRVSGLSVELPLPIVPRIQLTWVNVSVNRLNKVELFTRKGIIPVTVTADPETGELEFSVF